MAPELANGVDGGISAKAMPDPARPFKRLRPPTPPSAHAGRPTFGRRTSIPEPTPAKPRTSRAAQVFCAVMIVYGIVMIFVVGP